MNSIIILLAINNYLLILAINNNLLQILSINWKQTNEL